MTCDRCGRDVAPVDMVSQGDAQMCEDCLMDVLSPAKACDPWAVKMATGSVKTTADAAASLRGLERKIYDLVCREGKIPKTDLPERVQATPREVERAFSVLRHMELLRGQKEPDGTVVVTRFSG